METSSTYFTRRAREERTSALDAASAEARTAHLEMAFRLVKAATEPGDLYRRSAAPLGHNDNAANEWSGALQGAFPVRASDEFQHLLDAVDGKIADR